MELTTDVCLVVMPYAEVERASLALSLLKAILAERNISATTLYPNLWLAEEIGLDIYTVFCNGFVEDLVGEWTFAGAAFPEFEPDHNAYFDLVLRRLATRLYLKDELGPAYIEYVKLLMKDIRRQASVFVERVAEAVLALQPRIVGCSSTFQQHCASLALLRRIRSLAPEIITILGGANCEGPMGRATHQAFPWVDYVVSGEADELFGDFCENLLSQGRDLPLDQLPYGVFGPAHRCQQLRFSLGLNGTAPPAPRAMVHNLDQIPVPDFYDYFHTLEGSALAPFVKPGLPVETARGCWWGQKHHCAFCGLNGHGMGYRSKSPERALSELDQLFGRHKLSRFQVVDNILDMRYLENLLPTLAARPEPYSLFYETKANLRREQLELLSASGVRAIQPGIESMNDTILKLLDKGNTTMMNIQLLKWALEQGIQVIWNFLVNVPGETEAQYQAMMTWLPLIAHLQPPGGTSRIRYDRFSPYQQRPADYGLRLKPCRTYGYVYPLPQESLAELACFFEDELAAHDPALGESRRVVNRPGLNALQNWLGEWSRRWRISRLPNKTPLVLSLVDAGDHLALTDTRPCAVAPTFKLEGLSAQVYRACDQALTPKALLQALQTQAGTTRSWDEVEPVVAELRTRKILLDLNGRLLSLAVKEPCRPLLQEHPGGEVDLLKFAKFKVNRVKKVRALA
jgi:magnesium-protoporphyrin IX monomethyl ester (oxidative) cyclase